MDESVVYPVAVKCLHKTTTEQTLFHNFKSCGLIARHKGVTLLKYDNGASKCVGFINFMKKEGQTKALSEMNGKTIDGNVIVVEKGAAQENFQPLTDCHFHMIDQCTKGVSYGGIIQIMHIMYKNIKYSMSSMSTLKIW